VAQAVAFGLGIDMKTIVMGSASTDKIPNSSDTGGSGTSECAVQSAVEACNKLQAALKPIRDKLPSATWPQLIAAAAAQGVLLTATGYYNRPPGEYMFSYFVW
jgi:xanthine dehydrogenase/oxidase